MNGIPNSNSKRRKVLTYIFLLVLVLALAGGVAAYLMERSRVADLDQRNEELQTKVQQLQNKTDSSQPAAPSTDPVTTTYKSEGGVAVTVYTPASGAALASPLGVVGMVPGTWSFEADFPVILQDGNGKTIAQEPAQIQGDWMTEDDVPFAVTLTFDKPATTTGTLVLQKANPSGQAENDDFVSIPVKFQ